MYNRVRHLLVAALISGLVIMAARAQDPAVATPVSSGLSAPVEWRSFALPGQAATIDFPKLPNAAENVGYCNETATDRYAAFAADSVFVLSVTYKKAPGAECRQSERFKMDRFGERVAELAADGFIAGADSTSADRRLSKPGLQVRLLRDDKRSRWFELEVYQRSETKAAARFLNSLSLKPSAGAAEIGDGAFSTIGDPAPPPTPAPMRERPVVPIAGNGNGCADCKPNAASVKPAPDPTADPMVVAFKPRASYTELARSANLQGRVVLRVTFRANGAIGAVTVISALPAGLTEQAIAAARRIAFIPPRRGGVPYTVLRAVEYAFTIY